jgi:bacterioferritin
MHHPPQLTDVATLRARARAHLEGGAVTQDYQGDRTAVLQMFNVALATELVCMLRYKRHACMATGLMASSVAKEFAEHALEELGHADLLAARIVQLGGAPDFNPATLVSRSHAEYIAGSTLIDMLREDLVAERIAIASYGEMVRAIGDADPTSRRLLEGILATEEEHAEDLASLLAAYVRQTTEMAPPATGLHPAAMSRPGGAEAPGQRTQGREAPERPRSEHP